MKAGILAAGEGSRLQTVATCKPLVNVGGKILFERTINYLAEFNIDRIVVIFNEDERKMDFSLLPSLFQPNVNHFFKSTPSSLHSLYEVMRRSDLKAGEHIFVMMVDAIIHQQDFDNYLISCRKLPPSQSSVLITSYVEDEKPLTVALDAKGRVAAFQVPAGPEVPITSGIYCFSADTLPVLTGCVERGEQKMRNFLKHLVEQGHIIHTFLVDKTLDVDRPEDIASAEKFLELDPQQ